MKILFLIDTLEVGGSEQSLLHILARFKTVQPVLCHIYPGESLKSAFIGAGIPVLSLNVPNPYNFHQAIWRLYEVVRDLKPDLLHTTLFRADVIGRTVGRLAHIPVVSSFVNEPYHASRWSGLTSRQQIKLKLVQLLDQLTAVWVTHFMAVSQSARQSNCAALRISPEKVTVIYRGRLSTSLPIGKQQLRNEIRTALGGSESTSVLLNVARLLRRKGQIDLLHAMPQIVQEVPHTQLWIAGEGDDRSLIEKTVHELGLKGIVHLLGYRLDIADLLQAADLFIFPSHYEGHPGALIEAMLASCAIVASDISVHREMISEGLTGLLFPVGSSNQMVRSVVRMLTHPAEAKQMGRQARNTAIERFHIDQIVSQHEQMYEYILSCTSSKVAQER